MELLVNIDVEDLEKATVFYTSAFGLKVGRRLGESIVEILGGSSPIYLLAKPPKSEISSKSKQKRDYWRHWTPIHLDFVVDDIRAAVNRAKNAGALLEDEIRSNQWGHIAHMADPFGHGFCLIEFLGKGYDEVASELS